MDLLADSRLVQVSHISSSQTYPIKYYYPQYNCLSCSCFNATEVVLPIPNYQPLFWTYTNPYSITSPDSYLFNQSCSKSTLEPPNSYYRSSGYKEDTPKVSLVSKSNCSSQSASSNKSSRPFIAYPFLCPSPTPISDNYSSTDAYEEFRRKVLTQFKMAPVKRRGRACENVEMDLKRRKNNEAARRSRETRKAMEDEIAIRCVFLEQENAQIKAKLAQLELEAKMLEQKLCTR